MAKKRMIDTRFWHDSWIRKLNALDRYLFLYLMTNDKCSFCGIYELPVSIMAFETGIDERDLAQSMLPRLRPKVYYHQGWVCLVNFRKHHVAATSENSRKGYEAALRDVPKHIIDHFANIKEPLEAPSSPSDTIASAITIASIPPKAEEKKLTTPNANEVIDLFKEINPSFELLFKRRDQRSAAQRLFERCGLEQLTNIVGFIKANRAERYMPTVTTPAQLEEKWAALETFASRRATQASNPKHKVAFS